MRKLLSVVLVVALVATSVVFMPSSAYAKGKVKSIKVSKTKMSLQVGKSDSAKVTIKVKKKASKAFKVKTSNAKVATAKKKGKKVIVTGVGAGTAKITVTSKANKKKKKVIKVTVAKPAPADVAVNITQVNASTFEFAFAKKVSFATGNIKVETKEYSDGKYNHTVQVENVSSRDGVKYFVALKESLAEKTIVKFTVSGINKKPIVKEVTSYDAKYKHNTTGELVCTASVGDSFEADFYGRSFFNPSGSVSTSVSNMPSGLTSTVADDLVTIKGKFNNAGVQKAKAVFTDEKGITHTETVTFVVGSEKKLVTYTQDKEVYVGKSGYKYYSDSYFYVAGGSGSYNLTVGSYSTIYNSGDPYDMGLGYFGWSFEVNTPGTYEGIVNVTDAVDTSVYATVSTKVKAEYGIEVTGTVKTKTGKVVEGAYIESFLEEQANREGVFTESNVTDENGEYTLIVPKGKYTIEAELYGAHSFERHKTISQDCKLNFTLDLYQFTLSSDDPEVSFTDDIAWKEDNTYYRSHKNIILLPKGKHKMVAHPNLLCKELTIDTNVVGEGTIKVGVKNLTLDLGDSPIEVQENGGQTYSFTPLETGDYEFYGNFGSNCWYNWVIIYDSSNNQIASVSGYSDSFSGIVGLNANEKYIFKFYAQDFPTKGTIHIDEY